MPLRYFFLSICCHMPSSLTNLIIHLLNIGIYF
jgi:hypothetical protein